MTCKQVTPTPDRHSAHLRLAAGPRRVESERTSNAPIRDLLQVHGLRTSLFRLKVLTVIALAVSAGHSITVRGVHDGLGPLSGYASRVSVREVLKRLAEEGVLVFGNDKTWAFTPGAWAMLKPHFEPA